MKASQITDILSRWNLRQRVQQSLLWVPRGGIFGLLVAIGIALLARTRPLFTTEETLASGALAALAGGLAALIGVWLWPRPMLRSACSYDRHFGLKERLSTALELAGAAHLHPAGAEIAALQGQDALDHARRVDVRAALPLRLHWRDLALLAALALALAAIVLLPNPQAQAVEEQQALEGLIEEQAEDLREMRETVFSDEDLSDEAREEMLETLDEAIETLEQPEVSREEAIATLSEAEERFREMGQPPQAAQDLLDTLDSAGEEADTEMQESAGTESEQAEALEQAAEAIEETNPEMAQAMQEAAEALREGDPESAQETLQEMAQQQEAQQQTAQEMAGQMQQGQQELAQQQGEPQQGEPQQGEPQQGQPPGAQAQPGEGQAPQSDQAPPSGEQGEPGEEEGQEGESGGGSQSSESPDEMSSSSPGEGNQPGAAPGEGMQQAQGAEQGSNEQAEIGGSGAGEGEGDFAQGDESFEAGAPMQGNNRAEQSGTRDFPPVFAPSRIGGESEAQLDLPFDPEDMEELPIVPGDPIPLGEGESLVPYSEVYGDYARAADDALDTGHIPLGLRGVIRAYFTSLEP